MEDKAQIPYVVHESIQARNERVIKRLVVALIIAIVLIFASNAMWLYAWMGYDYNGEELKILVDGKEGVANYIGESGSIVNGTNSSDNQTE